ncbi:type IV pilin protein [Halanaerobacter jeridensis]|uniref:General secretion pathway protein G n=1 Tax=Halanaerobacter jeridensis TaxID=706427 RepID=A0A938XZ39_9FIRM|nr:prepilin-type N-terminal cleavage/methylation domain-containing protein [Halanaerobacter jeridensis]MBM7557955.1 general secretion pathway protein G [Halanaerobacter jeridensis]
MIKLNGEQGFTLIELMIVIAIIGILAAVAIPQLTGVRGKANVSAVQSEFKSIQTSMEMYYIDNGSYATDLADLASGDYASTEQIQDMNGTEYDDATGASLTATTGGGYELKYPVPNTSTTVTLNADNGVTVTN